MLFTGARASQHRLVRIDIIMIESVGMIDVSLDNEASRASVEFLVKTRYIEGFECSRPFGLVSSESPPSGRMTLISCSKSVWTVESIAKTSTMAAAYCLRIASSAATLSGEGASALDTGVDGRPIDAAVDAFSYH
jgi:hypothetical protein